MDRVVQYINEKFKHAGKSKAVLNQKEELIASLHDKVTDLMAQGKTEDDAFREAVTSLDGLEELTEALGGRSRMVYINRLKFHHSLLVFAVITLEILACYLFLPFRQDASCILPDSTNPLLALSMFLGPVLLAVVAYPLICAILCMRKPQQARLVAFDFRKLMTGALIGWLAFSLFLFAVNVAFPPHYRLEYIFLHETASTPFVLGPFDFGIGIVFWFFYPMIGIFAWPVSILIYNLLFKNKRYLVKQ